MKAVVFGAQSILLGDAGLIVAGGMESMTSAPHYLPSGRSGIKYGDGVVLDAIKRDGLQDPYDGSMMGNCGEVCAAEKHISRQQQDEYAWASYERARHAQTQGWFRDEIVPLSVQQGKNTLTVETDEELSNTRISGLTSLQSMRPAFDKNGTITAGNASKINDGAAALVLASAERVKTLGLQPIARILSYADANQQPVWFTTTPALAMPLAATKAGLTLSDIDYFEINEAFAVVALANMQQLGLPHERVNVFGGAIALGHPIGASGARIICTLLSVLRQRGGKRGMAGICNGGGGATALVVELL
jgi:acetyl-CoA C-acetyltransferase